MTRLTMLFIAIAIALVLPGAALAQPGADLRAPDRDQGTRGALAQPVPSLRAPDRDQGTRAALAATLHGHGVDQAAATDGNGVSLTLAIAGGIALILLSGG